MCGCLVTFVVNVALGVRRVVARSSTMTKLLKWVKGVTDHIHEPLTGEDVPSETQPDIEWTACTCVLLATAAWLLTSVRFVGPAAEGDGMWPWNWQIVALVRVVRSAFIGVVQERVCSHQRLLCAQMAAVPQSEHDENIATDVTQVPTPRSALAYSACVGPGSRVVCVPRPDVGPS